MALINRFTSLVTADVHAVLDKLEDPLASLQSAVREMESSLVESNQQLENYRKRQESLNHQLQRSKRAFQDYSAQLDTCFDSNEHELAKTILRKKLSSEKQQSALENEIAMLAAKLDSATSAYVENERRLLAMREKLQILASETEARADENARDDSFEYLVADEEIEVAFLQEQQRRAKK
ncbi:MAG: PspA/IM30 family protein [Pseudomonadota bacterium]